MHIFMLVVLKGTHVHDKSTTTQLSCSPTHLCIQMDQHCVMNKVPCFCPAHLHIMSTTEEDRQTQTEQTRSTLGLSFWVMAYSHTSGLPPLEAPVYDR